MGQKFSTMVQKLVLGVKIGQGTGKNKNVLKKKHGEFVRLGLAEGQGKKYGSNVDSKRKNTS